MGGLFFFVLIVIIVVFVVWNRHNKEDGAKVAAKKIEEYKAHLDENPVSYTEKLVLQASNYPPGEWIVHNGTVSMIAKNSNKKVPVSQIISVDIENNFAGNKKLSSMSIRTGEAADSHIRMTRSVALSFAGEQIVFNISDLATAYRIRDYITEYSIPNVAPTNTQVNSTSTADELLKLKSLLDDGILTQEEFDAQKKSLLG